MKTLAILLFALTSLLVNAGWEKIDMGMYDVMKLDGAEIISETTGGKNGQRLITTMRVGFDYYRCSNYSFHMKKLSCWKLSPDK
jgi:hypothetical protein